MDNNSITVLVDFEDGEIKQVARMPAEQLAKLREKSEQAVEQALDMIGWVADKAKVMLDKSHDRPDTVELEFGIRLGTKAGAIVLQGEADFHIKATVIWHKPK